MNHDERMEIIEAFLKKECFPTLRSKGSSYARKSNDVNANFKRAAKNLDLNKYQVWAVYYQKQYDALLSFIEGGEESEPIYKRILDLVNYPLILLTMLVEDGIVIAARTGEGQFITKFFRNENTPLSDRVKVVCGEEGNKTTKTG